MTRSLTPTAPLAAPIRRPARRAVAGLAALLALTAAASAGGTAYTTVQLGNWADPATWDQGTVPGGGPADQAYLAHDVTVDSIVPDVAAVNVLEGDELGLRIVAGALLDTNQLNVATTPGVPAWVEQTGGTVTPGLLRLGLQGPGSYELSGGTLQTGRVEVGEFMGTVSGRLSVRGAAATATVDEFIVFTGGSLDIFPSAAGAAGLTTIATSTVVLDGAELAIRPTYAAEVGDSWDLFTYSLGMAGSGFASIPPLNGMEFALDTSTPGVVRAVVTASPYPFVGNQCADAIPLQLGVQQAGTFSLATLDGPATSCDLPFVITDLWFSYTHTGAVSTSVTAELRDDTGATKTYTALELWDGCGGAVIACAGNEFDVTQPAAVTWTAQPGATYRLRAALLGSGPHPYTLDLFEDGGWADVGGGSPGVNGVPTLTGTGVLLDGETAGLELTDGPVSAPALAWLSLASNPFPALGGTVHAWPFVNQFFFATSPNGEISLNTTWPAGVPAATDLWIQFLCADGSVPDGITLSNAIRGTTPLGFIP